MKFKFIHFFKSQRAVEMSDFVATKIEKYDLYLIHKIRPRISINNQYGPGDIIDKQEFEKILSRTQQPIILSDQFIDIEAETSKYLEKYGRRNL